MCLHPFICIADIRSLISSVIMNSDLLLIFSNVLRVVAKAFLFIAMTLRSVGNFSLSETLGNSQRHNAIRWPSS